ncbi:MAG: hypothetical protein RIA65_15920 [Woeseia sp.]
MYKLTGARYLLLLPLALFALQARASDGYSEAVEACLQSVNAKLDLQHANKVRHVVNRLRTSGIGEAMEIETSVHAASRTRTYESYCVASGSNLPTRFRMGETTL